jgi:hypothetical protein
MISRLKTTNPDLAEKINSAALSDAKAIVMAILAGKLTTLPERAAKLLPESFEVQSSKVTQHQINALDDRYFNAEEINDAEEATALFIAARLLAAVMLWQTATNHFELCEAAYEADFAADQYR